MSTRCNVVIKDKHDKLIFYRHSDGYPEVTGESLKVFLEWVTSGKIRDNVSQAAGWLIILGHEEYKKDGLTGWKVGAYEPTTEIHGDIEYLYEIDLSAKTLKYLKVRIDSESKTNFIQL